MQLLPFSVKFYQKDSIFFHYCRSCLLQVILNRNIKFSLGLGFCLASCDFGDSRGVNPNGQDERREVVLGMLPCSR